MKRNSQIKRRTPLASKTPIARKREKRQPVQKARRKAQKDHRFRSQAYLTFVRALPCAMCGTTQGVIAHHLIGMWGMSGMGLKAPDSFVMPLCDGPGDTCHRLVHSHGHLRAMQPDWMRQTIRAGLAEFGGDQEIREALTHALVTIEAREST